MRALRIPYAIDIENREIISATDVSIYMEDVGSTLRLQATAHRDTKARRALRYECPVCGGKLYPHAPFKSGGRYFWSHLPRGASRCPLEAKKRLTPDQINAQIFRGRQEGPAHRNLVELLARLAEADPNVGDVTRDEYLPPTNEMRSEFPYGRFPDVRFASAGSNVVLEAQLATITLHGINGRRAFYDREGSTLLWVMRNFDPSGPISASVRDIIADQIGLLFSIDNDVVALSNQDRIFRLRCWNYVADNHEEPWRARIVSISEAAALARPIRWCDDFKKRWIAAYPSAFHDNVDGPDPYDMLNEVALKARLEPFKSNAESARILSLVRLMISLEVGRVTGSGHSKVISLANNFEAEGNHRALSLVCKAIGHWQPQIMKKRSMKAAFERARQRLRGEGTKQWGRSSPIGKIREVLFPDWKLADPQPVDRSANS